MTAPPTVPITSVNGLATAAVSGDAAQLHTATKRAAYRPTNAIARVLMWPLWPVLDDHTGRPSGPKCMAWAIYGATMAKRPIGAPVALLLLATMFGYSMFKAALAKASLNLASSDSVHVSATATENITRTITELRGVTGEALRSLPAVLGAKTPSGDD
jgi:hypothetical protein